MFVQFPQAKHKSVAFLPHTFRFLSPLARPDTVLLAQGEPPLYAYGSSGYHIGAYWHEMTGGRDVAAFGLAILILNNKHLPKDPADLTYERMLEVADGHRDLHTGYIQLSAARKLGNPKPYSRDAVFGNNGLGAHSFQAGALEQMREDITFVPDAADGWYARRPGVKA